MTSTLDSSAIAANGGPSSVTVQLAGGVLANVAAAPECVAGTVPHYTPDCLVGNGTVSDVLNIPLSVTAYLVPPSTPADIAGVDLVLGAGNFELGHAEISVAQLANGSVIAALTLDLSKLGFLTSLLTGLTVNINGTVNSSPFTRLPSTNNPASPSMLSVVYGSGTNAKTETTNATPDITPSGAPSLPYAPHVKGSATRDAGDAGVEVATTVTQAANEAATGSATLTLASGMVFPNLTAAVALLNSNVPVGSATAASPLILGTLNGQVFLTGSILAPALTIKFPAPFRLTLVGMIDIFNSSFAFPSLPDVPLTSLTVTLNGGSKALLNTTCATPTGALTGTFTGQNGKAATSTQRLSVQGCAPLAPTMSGGSVTGLVTGHAKVRFRITHATNGPYLASISVGLPGGLSFSRTRAVTRRTCAPNGKCRMTLSVTGLTLAGGSVRATKLVGGRFVIIFKKPTKTVLVTMSGPLLSESTALRQKAKQHRVKSMTLSIRVTNARPRTSKLLAGKLQVR